MTLSGKVVVVLGGKGLLGQEISRACKDQGAEIVAVDVDVFDATDEAQVISLAKKVKDEFGRVDGVVNATYPRTKNFGKKFEEGDLDEMLENTKLHLKTCMTAVRAFSPLFKEQKEGAFVFLASIYGSVAPKFELYEGTNMTVPAEYAAAKGAVLLLTKYFASLLGKDGIRVNAVSAGGIEANQPQSFIEGYSKHVKIGEGLLSPEDISGAVVFLLSNSSKKITGQNLIVDAGWSL